MEPNELRLHQIELSNGDRFWLLLGHDGVPDFHAAKFIASKYQEGKASNTLRNIANAVRVVRRFEAERVDIRQRLSEGRILTRRETAKLVADCGRPLGRLRRAKKASNTVVPFKQPNLADDPSLDSSTQRIRSFYAADYIEFLVDEETEMLGYEDKRRQSLKAEIARLKTIVKELAPKRAGTKFDPEKPLTQEAASKIKDIVVQADVAKLLFKQAKTRRRNLLLVEVLLDTGARASDVARLQIDDVDEESTTLWFRRNPSDSRRDTRLNRPGFKTRERPIKISADLMRRLASYMSARDGGRPRKAKHGYVFCANGSGAEPLSLSSIYRIVRTLEKVFGTGWKKRITPHVLRHTFFDLWFREANNRYDFRNNPELFDQVVAAAELTGGWRPDSKMISHYKQRFVFEQANEVTLGTQKRMCSPLRNAGHVGLRYPDARDQTI